MKKSQKFFFAFRGLFQIYRFFPENFYFKIGDKVHFSEFFPKKFLLRYCPPSTDIKKPPIQGGIPAGGWGVRVVYPSGFHIFDLRHLNNKGVGFPTPLPLLGYNLISLPTNSKLLNATHTKVDARYLVAFSNPKVALLF